MTRAAEGAVPSSHPRPWAGQVVSSAGCKPAASAWRFDSSLTDAAGPRGAGDSASGSEPEGRPFESGRGHRGLIAQRTELPFPHRKAGRSSRPEPARGRVTEWHR